MGVDSLFVHRIPNRRISSRVGFTGKEPPLMVFDMCLNACRFFYYRRQFFRDFCRIDAMACECLCMNRKVIAFFRNAARISCPLNERTLAGLNDASHYRMYLFHLTEDAHAYSILIFMIFLR